MEFKTEWNDTKCEVVEFLLDSNDQYSMREGIFAFIAAACYKFHEINADSTFGGYPSEYDSLEEYQEDILRVANFFNKLADDNGEIPSKDQIDNYFHKFKILVFSFWT